MMVLHDLIDMPDFNPATQNDRGDWGLHCISDGTVHQDQWGKPWCMYHGAMNAVVAGRALWRCLMCGRGCYVTLGLLPRAAQPLVISGTYKQFLEYCRDRKLRPGSEALWVRDRDTFNGHTNNPVVWVGTYYWRRDYHELVDTVAALEGTR